MDKAVQICFERYETKYLITKEQYLQMLSGIADHVHPDVYPRYTISNIYYDTDNYRLIRDSLERPAYKEKLRLRSYGLVRPGQTVFLEMKKKYNGLVFKRRISLTIEEALAYLQEDARPSDDNQICKEIDWVRQFYALKPQAFIGYEREAYTGIEDRELRITFDTALRWRNEALDLRKSDAGEPLMAEDTILMEIKLPGTFPFWLARLLGQIGIRQTSCSKYGECYRTHLFFDPEKQCEKTVYCEGTKNLPRKQSYATRSVLAAAHG